MKKIVTKERAEEKKKLRQGFLLMLLAVAIVLSTILTCLSCDPNSGNNGLNESQIVQRTYFWEAEAMGTKWSPQISDNNSGIPPFSRTPLDIKFEEELRNNKLIIGFYTTSGILLESGTIKVEGNEGLLTLTNSDSYKVKFSSDPDGNNEIISICFDDKIFYSKIESIEGE